MIYKQKLITLMTILLLMSVGWGLECEEGEVSEESRESKESWDPPRIH